MTTWFDSADLALADTPDGVTVLIGGFAGAGSPGNLIDALARQGARNLTVVMNAVLPGDAVDQLFANGQVTRMICTFPVSSRVREMTAAERALRAGEIALELVPQGTLVERIRAGGAGLPAFFTPVGVGTVVSEGKEVREFDGRPCLLERAITADLALIRAARADGAGNLVYDGSARNFNPVMATAARTVVVEVAERVETGALIPECVVTPGLLVDRIVVTARRPERGR
ncbi:MAG: 3-oxoacid CoA-transferase subunit A [Dehalococcoidia bacterium]